MDAGQTIFGVMCDVDVSDYVEKKNGLTYLSWAHAWREFCKKDFTAKYEIIKDSDGNPYFGNNKIGYMVYTRVTSFGITHEMWLPVMDYRNKSILEPTTFDINKSIMRCLTKNLAMFGLGLYIYAGEDLPEGKEEPLKVITNNKQEEQTLSLLNLLLILDLHGDIDEKAIRDKPDSLAYDVLIDRCKQLEKEDAQKIKDTIKEWSGGSANIKQLTEVQRVNLFNKTNDILLEKRGIIGGAE